MKKVISFGLFFSLVPYLSLYANSGTATIATIIQQIIIYLGYIVPALIAVAVIYFVWGVITFIASSEEEGKKKGRQKIINGLIGLFVIVAFWGLIAVVKRSFQINNDPGGSIVPVMPIPYQ
jgi:hypothetical protein